MVEIIKKWYAYLDFPSHYDGEFAALLERRAGELKPCDPFDYSMEEDMELSLLMALYFCEITWQRYQEKEIPEKVFYDTMQDIVRWNETCVRVHGTMGLESQKWVLNNHVKMNMFKLGRLQYRPVQGKLDSHIPEGEKLTMEACLDSFAQANEFFPKYFPEHAYTEFYCGTWLLDPKVLQFVGEKSNIADFQKLFEVYEVLPDTTDGAVGFIFEWGATKENLAQYTPQNRFAREIKDYVLSGGELNVVRGRRPRDLVGCIQPQKSYVIRKTDGAPDDADWARAEVAQVTRAPWPDAVLPYTMEARLLHSEDTLYVKLVTNERPLRATKTQRNDQVCEDSCMELFLCPDNNDARYLNFEINPLGTLLLYVCTGRQKMVPDEPDVAIFNICSTITQDTWQLTYEIPYDFFRKYFRNVTTEMRGNFYKCGDNTLIRHYGCWNPVEVHDFHQPGYFGKFILE